jgi:hypothetical protein
MRICINCGVGVSVVGGDDFANILCGSIGRNEDIGKINSSSML